MELRSDKGLMLGVDYNLLVASAGVQRQEDRDQVDQAAHRTVGEFRTPVGDNCCGLLWKQEVHRNPVN